MDEALGDLEERTGLQCAYPRPLSKGFQFSFEKKDATVKEVLEKIAADGKLDLEYHENTAVFWKKADDKQLEDLAELLKSPGGAEHALGELSGLADPRIYPLLFAAAKDNKLINAINVALWNGHRDTFCYGKDLATLVDPILKQMKKPGMKEFWFETLTATRDKRAIDVLLESLKAEDDGTRMSAAEHLGSFGDPKFIPFLIKMLKDPNQNVGIGAMWGWPKSMIRADWTR